MIKKIFLQLRSDILSELYDENLANQMIFKKIVDYCYNYFILLRSVSIFGLCPSTIIPIIQTLPGILIGIMVTGPLWNASILEYDLLFWQWEWSGLLSTIFLTYYIRSLEDVKITLSLKSMKRYLSLWRNRENDFNTIYNLLAPCIFWVPLFHYYKSTSFYNWWKVYCSRARRI